MPRLPRVAFAAALAVSTAGTLPAQEFDRVDATDQGMTTGPGVGERIPAFSAVDQHGRRLGWEEIKGPQGALILFYRSADW